MTDWNRDTLHLASLGPKAVVADFPGGRLTRNAGTLLLREVADRIGLFEARDAAIPDPRNPLFILHDQHALIAQRVTAIALGYEDLNDHQDLRADPVLQGAAGKLPEEDLAHASPPTLCRLENRVERATLVKVAEVLVDPFLAAHTTPPEPVILDVDATDDRGHGKQEGRCCHGYYDLQCFLPFYVFCGDELLAAYLRPSHIDAAKHARAVLTLLVRKLRAVGPGVTSTVRGDSGFCRWRLLRWCDSHGLGYVRGLAKDPVLEHAAGDEIARAERQVQRTGQPQRLFGSFAYAASPWDRPRRVIVKAEHNAQGANPRFIVTNVPGDPQEFDDDVYCQRGEMANRIQEQQVDRFADRTSCHRFLANQFRLLLSSAAYVLVQALRRTTRGGTELACAQVGTIRLKRFQVAARVVVTARRVVFHLARSYPYHEVFRSVSDRLTGRQPRPAAVAS